MRIIIVNTLYAPYAIGGAEKSVQTLAEGFSNLENEVLVITLGKENSFFELNGVSVNVLKLENKYWPFGYNTSTKFDKLEWHIRDVSNKKYDLNIKNILISFKPDILFTNNLVGFSTRVWSIAKTLNIKIVHTLRDYYLQCPKTVKFRENKNCEKLCFDCNVLSVLKKKRTAKVDFVVGISEYVLNDHLKNNYFKDTPSQVIYNGFDIEKSNPIHKTDGIVFGFIGQINKTKGIELLLKSFLNLKETNWKLLIAGKVDSNYLDHLKSINNSKNIEYLGYVNSTTFFKKIDVLITPSLWNEPFGRVVIESIFNKKPVLGSRTGGISELLSNNKEFLFNPIESELHILVKKIISNKSFLKNFKFDEKFLYKFSKSKTIESYSNVFNKVINQNQ